MNSRIQSCVLTFTLTVILAACSQATTLEDIFAEPVLQDMRVSPDGKHLVGVGPYAFQFMDSGNLQMTSPRISVNMDDRESITELMWVNDERVLYTVDRIVGPSPFPWWPGNFYSVNPKGNQHSNPFNRGADEPEKQLRFRSANSGNPRTVLMQEKDFRNFREIYESTPSIIELEVYSKKKGRRTNRQKGPLPFGDLYVGNEGIARVAYGVRSGTPEMHYREAATSEWMNITEASGIGTFGAEITFVGFAGDNKSFYILGNHENGLTNLYLYSPSANEYQKVYGHDVFDIRRDGVVLTPKREKVLGVTLMDPFSSFVPLASQNMAARYWLTLSRMKEFTDYRLSIAGLSNDGNVMLLLADRMDNPGIFYRFNAKSKMLDPVAPKKPGVSPAEMSNTMTFRVKAHDGISLYVNLTIPKNAEGPAPLIVLPHAGPHQVYDEYGFNPEVQAYALSGYAVVQVNYRGSAGRGIEFATAGFGEWAGAIIEDVLTATRYAQGQEKIDGERVCIAGSHYGAFVALTAAIKEPELFKCVIGNQGLYDLSYLWNGQVPAWPIDPFILNAAIGNDTEALAAASPTNNVDKIKAAVLLSHGGKDGFAPPRHHRSMVSALRRGEVEFVNVDEISGAHGFRDPESKTRLYEQILEFVAKHI